MDEQIVNMHGDGRGLWLRCVVTGTIVLIQTHISVHIILRFGVLYIERMYVYLKVHVCIFDGDLHRQDLGGGVILQEEGEVSQ